MLTLAPSCGAAPTSPTACFAYADHVQLQNESLESHWRFKHTWQETFLRGSNQVGKLKKRRSLQVQGFYSDLLYQPWHCSTAPLQKSWLKRDTIDRRADLSVEEFKTQYELPNKPVILQQAVSRTHLLNSAAS